MSRVFLVHWKAAEAAERTGRLQRAGHEVVGQWSEESGSVPALRDSQPEVVLIDLTRLPSHGRAVAVALRQQKGTRGIPLVFAGGQPARAEAIREVLPDACFTSWRGVRGAIERALASLPADPVVPGSISGYSGTPLLRKLGIKAGCRLALLGAPEGFDDLLGALPDGVTVRRQARGAFDVVLLFAGRRSVLQRRFAAAAGCMAEKGRLWIAWPKQRSGLQSDLTQADVRGYGMDRGLVDYKICAIDPTWSGLCFSKRKP